MSDLIVKGAGRIYSRLFDDSQFLAAEIQYILSEFEEKRKDREIDGLFSTLQNTVETRDSARGGLTADFSELRTNLTEALNACNEVLEAENDPNDQQKQLQINRVNRKEQWQKFVDDLGHKCSRIDSSFEEKEVELRRFYSNLEQKLQIQN